MKTIKIILNDDGSVLSLSCGFQLNQYSYNDTLLNVYVPSNILENQTDLENVDYSNNVVMGMYYTLANGSQKVGNPYYFTFVKDNVVIDNKLYTLYERKMPKEFTLYYGTQTYSINVVALKTTINNGVATNEVIGNITSNNFELNIVRSMNMVDDGIEEDTDLSTLIANVNSLLANMLLKQDKSDVLIQVSIANGSNVKTSVVREALNNLNSRVAENYTNITTNTGDITQLKQDVIDINNSMITGMRYCGSVTSPNTPTSALLDSQMSTWGLTKQNGDTIIWTETISGATDKSYTCRYGISGWTITDMPTVETASNTDMGLIQGNYGANDNTSNIIASIVGGKIVDIYYNRNGIYYELASNMDAVITAINGLVTNGSVTAIKSQYATYDNSEYGSNNPLPINQKYMTKSEGATQQFVIDYALPKTFNDIYRFDFTNNKLVSNSVNTSKTLATQLGSVDFGSYTIEKSDVLTFELSNKNTFACNFYAMFDNNITDVTFTIIIKADNTPIASTTSETTDFTGGTYKKISINGDFALLGDSEITIDDSVTLSVELSANITTSATNNLTIYSNTTLPSAFTLNVASSTIIINGSGVLGGVNYHTLSGVKTNNDIDFALPNDTTLVDETIHTFILNYSGITPATNTTLYITNGNVRCNINLPSNYNSGNTLTFESVSQFLAPNSIIVFTAIYENGFFTIIGGNTLSSTQIQALLNAKQDKIDSSHKLDADLVAENSSRVFVTPTQKQQIGTNASDISSLDGRVTNLENNMPSAVSGTNDGTNWTSITIGNDTYAIPSGSSGGSGSGETLKIIEFNGMFVNSEVFQLGITKTKLDYFFNLLSQGMGITVNEDNLQTIWANSNDYEKMTAFHSLTYFALFMKYGMQTVCYVKATTISVDNQTVVTALNLVTVDTNGVSTSTTNESDLSSSTISITTIGGGSSASESYYKIVLEDVEQAYQTNDLYLYMLLEKSRMATVLDGVNQQVGTSLQTPQDLIDFFDTIKGNSTYYQSLCKLFATICDICMRDNTTIKYDTADGLSQITSVSATLGAVSIAGSGNDMSVINALVNTATDIKILFTSSSTLTITEQNNQKI